MAHRSVAAETEGEVCERRYGQNKTSQTLLSVPLQDSKVSERGQQTAGNFKRHGLGPWASLIVEPAYDLLGADTGAHNRLPG
jgi:hypothetical protein